MTITATDLYNYCICPTRVGLDRYGDPVLRQPDDPFVEMLWEQGIAHEEAIVGQLNVSANLAGLPAPERVQATLSAMAQGSPLIYQGRLVVGDRVCEPDLLERTNHGYQPGDIKSGAGLDGDEEDGKLKKPYALQLGHEASMLDELGYLDPAGDGFVLDGKGERYRYPLMQPQGIRTPETWMDAYQAALDNVRGIVAGSKHPLPVMAAICKQCHWKTACEMGVRDRDDLTLIAELGRSKRDVMMARIPSVRALATLSSSEFEELLTEKNKTVFPGIGAGTLRKFRERAVLLSTPGAKPYIKAPIHLPVKGKEIYFDIETNPLRNNFLYLHGFVERLHGRPDTSKFVPVTVPDLTPEAEEEAFAKAVRYLQANLGDAMIYYYSAYERTLYKLMAKRYPSVCSVDDIEAMFAEDTLVDFFSDVIRPATEWPTNSQSIKPIAKFCGFSWRDPNPSGAASIQWFEEWLTTKDPARLNRVLDYNEDDCLATGVVVDAVREMLLLQPEFAV